MKEKILQFAKGNFEESQSRLKLSENSLTVIVEEGRDYAGNFYIGNDGGISMKGILYSECPYLTIKQKQFSGYEVLVDYVFSAAELVAGETIDSQISIISSCGEVVVPIHVTVEVPTVRYADGKISDLASFAALAKESTVSALKVFQSDDFESVFLHRDIQSQVLYSAFMKSSEPPQAMEEFLIAMHKKNRIVLSVDKNNICYRDCNEKITDRVMITRSTWGSAEISIYSNAEYIVPAHKKLWTDDFIHDCMSLEFSIYPELMRSGINTGSIFIETVHQCIEIKIECVVPLQETSVNAYKRYKLDLVKAYVQYSTEKIDEREYISKLDSLIVEYREKCPKIMHNALEVYRYSLLCADKCVDDISLMPTLEVVPKPSRGAALQDVIDYCAYCYVKAMSSTEDKQSEEAAVYDEISYLYNNGYACMELFWFTLKLAPRYRNYHSIFCDIVKLLEDGCTSPLIYIEFCRLIKENPELMHEWNDCMIAPLIWGIREDLFNRDMAMAFTYHIGRRRVFNRLIFKSLEKLYHKFELEDTLCTICSMLIKSDVISSESLEWYEKGIIKQLRLTQIYEYYMQSLSDNNDRILPNQVLMYFLYDNHLADREKAILFASVIRGKEINPSAYKAYSVMINNFAREQLEKCNISASLSVIYEDSIKLYAIDESLANVLPEIMFRYEIICNNPRIKKVVVVHHEIEKEACVSLINGRAMIDIYAENALIFLVDEKGNRYLQPDGYTLNKMLRLDSYADKCFEYAPDNVKLITYMFIKYERDYRIDNKAITVRKYADSYLELRKHFSRKNLSALIQYYYERAEGEYLDDMLKSVNLDEVDKSTRQKWIELFIIRGMYPPALDAISKYGTDEINISKLGKFCDDMIARAGCGNRIDELVDIAYKIFSVGRYSENILRYLAEFYIGPSNKLIELWKVVKGFDLSRTSLEERVLGQLLFTEDNVEKGVTILESFLNSDGDKFLKKAYVSYLAYKNVIDNQELTDQIWIWMNKHLLIENNIIATIAILKKMAGKELNTEQKEFCDVKMTWLVKKGIIMPFFREFASQFKLPEGIEDKIYVQCGARPKMDVMVRYTDGAEVTRVAKAQEVYHGIYVKELVVFVDETVKYEFFEEKSGTRNVLCQGMIDYVRPVSGEITRFQMINKMIECANAGQVDELYSQMECYVRLEQASKTLFDIL